MRLLLLLLVALTLAAGADRSPPSGQLTVLAAPWGEVYCATNCSFTKTRDNSRAQITTPRGQVHVAETGGWLNIQFPGHTARVRQTDNETLVQFGGQNYRFVRKTKREFQTRFPGEIVYYSLADGGLTTILGPNGAVTITRKSKKVDYEVTSEAGTSSYLVHANSKNKRKRVLNVITVDGVTPDKHPYLVRGVRFEDAGVGIFIPLPGGPLTTGLDWKATRLFTVSVAPPPPPPPPAGPVVDPLKALPTNGEPLKATGLGNTTLNASSSDADPLRMKSGNQSPKYPKGPDPLKVNEVPPGVDVLKVQEIDPNK